MSGEEKKEELPAKNRPMRCGLRITARAYRFNLSRGWRSEKLLASKRCTMGKLFPVKCGIQNVDRCWSKRWKKYLLYLHCVLILLQLHDIVKWRNEQLVVVRSNTAFKAATKFAFILHESEYRHHDHDDHALNCGGEFIQVVDKFDDQYHYNEMPSVELDFILKKAARFDLDDGVQVKWL